MTGQARPSRRTSHWIVPFWLAAAAFVSLVHRWVPEATWLMVHLVVLGALTQSVVRWGGHFAEALLKTTLRPRTDQLSWPLAAGVAGVLIGVPTGIWWVTIAGASLVSAVVLTHGFALTRALRRALPGRFRVVVRYYVAAALCLPVGATFGALLARGPDDSWHARLLLAHTMTNLLGWVGLTVIATFLTLFPTVLRTRAHPKADRIGRQALPVLLVGLVATDAGALAGLPALTASGLAVYLAGTLWTGRAAVWVWREFWRLHGPGTQRERPARLAYAGGAFALAALWFLVGLVVTIGAVLRFVDPRQLTDAVAAFAPIWVVGFGLQLLTGALTYLLPTVLHGGSTVFEAGWAHLERASGFRLAVLNAGLLLWFLPQPSWVKVATSSLVLAVLIWFVVLMVQGVRAAAAELGRVRALRDAGAPVTLATPGTQRITADGVLAGFIALALAVSLGVLVDPGAVGGAPAPTASAVKPTGQTVRVRVEAQDMRFVPNRIEAKAGDRVIITLVNTDPKNTHDLTFGAARTKRLPLGASDDLDLGVVGASAQGWCTIVGHKQMGMVLDLVVAGGTGSAPGAAPPSATASAHHGTHDAPPALSRTVDPTTKPNQDRTHGVTLAVTEVPLEVAPGVWQTRWTYNGASVGPTLRGRVGDEFIITLVNDGTMGHSIDFHAGALAPDKPMRTIAPGETLEYRFTATRAGIWMYHCSTMPMSAHIAAGMHGAVIIDPPDLAPVDREYVLIQSEVYLTAPAAAPAEASEVSADALASGSPSYVAFNGIASQYDQAPFTARVGERVRFWVLDAGPNRPSSFHIVGAQFDTVYAEGAYLLKSGRDAFGSTGSGSQALALQPAQGGFVELTFPEPGRYPVVSHVMSDAERGAHGIVVVTP